MSDYTCGEKQFENARDLLDQQRHGEARDAFTELIALFPEWEGAYGNRGLALMYLGHDRKALEDFKTVIRLNSRDALGHARVGEALRNLEDYDGALRNAARALDLDALQPEAHGLRGWLFARCGQFEPAVEDLEVLACLGDEAGETEDLLDACRALAGNDPEAVADTKGFLASQGLSFNVEYNERYEEEAQFCPYAHCLRTRPVRGPEAATACPVTGYDCPGGSRQAACCMMDTPFDA